MEDDILVTIDELRAFDAGRQYDKIHTDDSFALSMIRGAHGALKRYIKFRPFANIYSQSAKFADGCDETGMPYVWPVGIGSSELTGEAVIDDYGRAVMLDSAPKLLRLVIGWKRVGQTAAEIQSIPALSELTTEQAEAIPDVNEDVFTALCEASLAISNHVRSGTLGITERNQDFGVSTITVRRVVQSELNSIFDDFVEDLRWVVA